MRLSRCHLPSGLPVIICNVLRDDDLAVDDLLKESSRAGWLYAVVAADVRLVKIGHARDVWSRILLFQTGSPSELALHSVTLHDDVRAAEADAHRELAHARRHGEWFDLTDTDVDAWLARRETDRPENGLWDRYVAA